jgi:hypothetical protein
VKNGPLTILDICAFELEYMLGPYGLAELRTMAREGPRLRRAKFLTRG